MLDPHPQPIVGEGGGLATYYPLPADPCERHLVL